MATVTTTTTTTKKGNVRSEWMLLVDTVLQHTMMRWDGLLTNTSSGHRGERSEGSTLRDSGYQYVYCIYVISGAKEKAIVDREQINRIKHEGIAGMDVSTVEKN